MRRSSSVLQDPTQETNSNKKQKVEHQDDLVFPTVFNELALRGPRTRLENKIIQLSQEIRLKPFWHEKIHDCDIRRKWRKEAEDQGVSKEMAYALAELRKYYTRRLIKGKVMPSPVDGVYLADNLISEDIKFQLIEQVAVLENVPSNQKDWHPGSNQQVLDLVHPSLFPLISGTTRVMDKPVPCSPFMGALGNIHHFDNTTRTIESQDYSNVDLENNSESSAGYDDYDAPDVRQTSATYQWLPAEFGVDENGKVTINSYINNLHPTVHADLYKTIASIFEEFVPLFNRMLIELVNPRDFRIPANLQYYTQPSSGESESDEDINDREDDTSEEERAYTPEVPRFRKPKPFQTKVDLKGRNLQVIVKIAEIVLTPEKPTYGGGVWHVEGMSNERIVGTGIYYFESSNILDSKLEFRRAVQFPNFDSQTSEQWLVSKILNVEKDEPLLEYLGHVPTVEDRCIAFPNIFQHKVDTFELEDKTKPGFRKILVFFLVDPSDPIVSTATVPPQQRSWMLDELRNMKGTFFEKLPKEIIELVVANMDHGMTLDEAKEHRELLMKERKYFVKQHSKIVFKRPFSFCEH